MSACPNSVSEQAWRDSGLAVWEIERFAEVARQAAAAGSRQLLHHFGRLERIQEKGSAGNLVTEADFAAEEAVLAVLAALAVLRVCGLGLVWRVCCPLCLVV